MKLMMRAMGAATVLSAVLVALPITLVKMVGYPLPTVMPSWDQVSLAIDLGHVESTTIFKALACVLWLVWAWFLVIATSEAVAHMGGRRGAGISRQSNPAHRVIARLVTSLAVVLTSLVSRSTVVLAEPAPLPAIELVSDLATTPTFPPTESLEVSTPQTQATALDSGAPTWTVRHRDSLWRIAERALGDGARWREIYELNRDVIGPEPTRITKGMTLVLPPGATVIQPTTTNTVHVVVPGDTLSQIAANELGDPGRFDELFKANADKTQPDGDVLRDPNLIRPGWSLDIPSGKSDSTQETDGQVLGTTQETQRAPQPSAPVITGDVTEDIKAVTDTTKAPAPNSTVALVPSPVDTPTLSTTETRSEQSNSPTQDTSNRFPLGGMVVGLPVLAGAGLLVRLKMLRRNQMRHHLPGRLVVTPPPTCEPLERHIRALLPEDSLGFLDAALRLLTRSLRENSTIKVPSVWGVQLGDGGVELLLEHANTTPPPGFLALHDGWSWALDPTLSLIDLTALVEGELPALVGLIGIGQTSEGSVFLNVEHCGVLSVEGEATSVKTFLMGCALDLTTPTWVQGMVSVLANDTVGELALLEDVELIDDPTEALTKLATEAQSSARALGTRSVMAARGQSNDVWPLKVLITKTLDDGNDVQAEDLSQLANAQAGAAVITSDEIPGATWRLSINAEGQATLAPLGITLDLSTLDHEVMTQAAQLLGSAAEIQSLAPVLDLTAPTQVKTPSPMPEVLLSGEVEVRILGPVEVTGWNRPPDRRMTTELVVYLATHSAKLTTSDRLRNALWPLKDSSSWGEGADPTLKSVVSRARSGLGDDSSGNRHLPEGTTAGYQLGERVWCDWTTFTAAVHAAGLAEPDESVELLRDALSLVRGAPFADVGAGTYSWAWSELIVSEIEVMVSSTASRLATIALDANDTKTAIWAARQGLLVTPSHEALHRLVMTATAQTGDLDALDQAFRDACRAAEALDPMDGVQPETAELYARLRQSDHRSASMGG